MSGDRERILGMAKDAYPYLIPLFLLGVLLAVLGFRGWALVFFLAGGFVAFFFRDPERAIPNDAQAVVSPADGKIVSILKEPDQGLRVSIFLSIFNVHINRAPIAGTIESVHYVPGKFKIALDAAASLENEQNVVVIKDGSSQLKFSQIAGILARRIVCWKARGDRVVKGERVGLIKFGSRVDLFLPETVQLMVKEGDHVKGGSSVIGRFKNV